MEKDTYESIQRELRKIEEEYEQNESMKKKIQTSEEDMQRTGALHIEYSKNQSIYWKRDARMQFLLQEQQRIQYGMQKERTRFLEEGMEKMNKRRQELAEQEEECYLRRRRLEEGGED